MARPSQPSQPCLPTGLREPGGQQGEQAARAEFPDPGSGDEVGGGRVGVRVISGVGQRAKHERRGKGNDGAVTGDRAQACGQDSHEQRRGDEKQRPEQVELLLHRQGPEVLDGAGRVGRLEVVDGVAGELPVLEVQCAGPDLAGGVVEVGADQHP